MFLALAVVRRPRRLLTICKATGAGCFLKRALLLAGVVLADFLARPILYVLSVFKFVEGRRQAKGLFGRAVFGKVLSDANKRRRVLHGSLAMGCDS